MSATAIKFLPYQVRWLKDTSKVKIWEKSRRIGATYVQSFEDVSDCIATPGLAVWFSSADETAAREYIVYCEQWAKLHQRAAKVLGEQLIDEKNGVKAYVIAFRNGSRIHALSSNPKAFRSKGGKVVLDEFGWHEDPDALWAAARPCIMWGHPLRILSTHNGTNSKFYRFIEDIRAGRLKWSLHTTPIQLAVSEGLADKIAGRKLTDDERAGWLKDEHDACATEDVWQQEYCCNAVDSASAFLTYEEIAACEDDHVLMPELDNITGFMTAGHDVGRKRDLSVTIAGEDIAQIYYVRLLKRMEKTRFRAQREFLWQVLAHKKLCRACLDASGIGMDTAEQAQEDFGKYRIENVMFTEAVKVELANTLKRRFEDRAIRIPRDSALREALHSIRKTTTVAGHLRFDAPHSATGHADEFWALALAVYGVSRDSGPVTVASGTFSRKNRIARGYDDAAEHGFVGDVRDLDRPRKIYDGY